MDLSLFLGVLKEGLHLWNSKEATKYIDRVISLEKDWNYEMSKSTDDRSDLKLDNIMLELKILSNNFIKYSNKTGK